jgi:hypothetical protein
MSAGTDCVVALKTTMEAINEVVGDTEGDTQATQVSSWCMQSRHLAMAAREPDTGCVYQYVLCKGSCHHHHQTASHRLLQPGSCRVPTTEHQYPGLLVQQLPLLKYSNCRSTKVTKVG